jgi:hypothetical protein
MVDYDQVIFVCKLFNGKMLEGLQGSLFPRYSCSRVGILVDASGGHHGLITARMIPRHTFEV